MSITSVLMSEDFSTVHEFIFNIFHLSVLSQSHYFALVLLFFLFVNRWNVVAYCYEDDTRCCYLGLCCVSLEIEIGQVKD